MNDIAKHGSRLLRQDKTPIAFACSMSVDLFRMEDPRA